MGPKLENLRSLELQSKISHSFKEHSAYNLTIYVLLYYLQGDPQTTLFYNRNFTAKLLGGICLPYVKGYSYCAANFDYERHQSQKVSSRKLSLTNSGNTIILEEEKWQYVGDAQRYH